MFGIVFEQTFILFVLIMIGVALGKSKILSDGAVKAMTDVVLYVVTPAVIIKSFAREKSAETMNLIIVGFVASLIIFAVYIIISSLLFGKAEEDEKAVLRFGTVFPNCGFMALPLLQATIGDDGVLVGAAFVASFNIYVWTYGVLIMSGDGKSMSLNKSHNYNFNWNGMLSIPTSFAYIHLDEYLTYASTSSNGTQQSVQGNQPLPNEWTNVVEGMVNDYTDLNHDKIHSLNYSAMLNATVKLPNDKNLGVNFAANYNTATDKMASLYSLLTQGANPTSDFRNRYDHNKQSNYQLLGGIDYALIEKEHGNMFHKLYATYNIDHRHQQGNRKYYRFDRLGGDWALPDRKHLGQLPSTTDSLALATDWANTYKTTTSQTMHTAELRYLLMKDGLNFYAALPMAFTRNAIDDLRMKDQQRHIVKHYQWLQPSFSLSIKNIKMSGSIAHTAPQMNLLLDVTDDSNPLFITKGNTTLKPTNIYNATLGYTLNKTKHAQNLNAEWGYSAQQNAVGQARYYDAETGVTTSMAQNINGNWQTHVTVGYACSLDKKQKWTFDVSATETFQNSVDFQQTSLMPTSAKSEVKNWFMQGNVALAYHCKLFNAALKSAVDWQHATSKLTGFQTINSINHLYTFTNQWSLPWSMVIDTDLTYYVRSGYADHSMNSGEWIWNMAVAKRMLKSKALSLKLSGHDILAQRRSIVRTLNAQGRTETWHNVVPRYFMLSLVYHFSKSPRKE